MLFALRFYKFSGEETADSRCHGVPRRSRGAAIWMETESGGGVERKNGRWEVEESTGRGGKLWTPATILKRLATNI